MSANDKQIGGTHYKHEGGEEHWDRIWRMYGPGYFVGSITKYVERYHLKNRVQDLEKAAHFLQKLRELEAKKTMDVAADKIINSITDPRVETTKWKFVGEREAPAEVRKSKAVSRRKMASKR